MYIKRLNRKRYFSVNTSCSTCVRNKVSSNLILFKIFIFVFVQSKRKVSASLNLKEYCYSLSCSNHDFRSDKTARFYIKYAHCTVLYIKSDFTTSRHFSHFNRAESTLLFCIRLTFLSLPYFAHTYLVVFRFFELKV